MENKYKYVFLGSHLIEWLALIIGIIVFFMIYNS